MSDSLSIGLFALHFKFIWGQRFAQTPETNMLMLSITVMRLRL